MSGITLDKRSDIPSDKIILEDEGGDTAEISSTGALKVAISQAPPSKVVYSNLNATNAGSSDLTVDGSVTPVVFEIAPPAGQIWYVFEYGIVIEDSGNNVVDNFGAIIGGLTNGVLIEQHIDGSGYGFTTLKTNLDIVETFTDHSFRGQSNAFLNSSNFFAGRVELRDAVTLNGDDGDAIHVHVSDDLTGLDKFRISIEYFRIL